MVLTDGRGGTMIVGTRSRLSSDNDEYDNWHAWEVTQHQSNVLSPYIAYPSIPAAYRSMDTWFRDYDVTEVGGERDQVWGMMSELADALETTTSLRSEYESLIQKVRILHRELLEVHAVVDTEHYPDDVVVFGDPIERRRVKGRVVSRRDAVPLLISEDFED